MAGPPPSRLGFQAKMEMPAHINIMFRARPPLEFIKPIPKNRCRPFDPIIDGRREYEALFEEQTDEELKQKDRAIESREKQKERAWEEKLKQNLKENAKKLKECKRE